MSRRSSIEIGEIVESSNKVSNKKVSNNKVSNKKVTNDMSQVEEPCSACPLVCKKNSGYCQTFWLCMSVVTVILICVLVPLSFSYVRFDEYALKKHTIDNTVDLENSYDMGRYYWGVIYEPLTFNRHYQRVTESFSIFPSSGIEFTIEIIFYYQVRKNHIGDLYRSFGTAYNDQVINRANAKIKNTAPLFDLDAYIKNRQAVTNALHAAVVEELNLIWIDLPRDKFHLSKVNIPDQVRQKDLDAAIQQQKNIEEQNRQLAIIVRKETERLQQQIEANITLISTTAQAERSLIIGQSQAIADKIISSADGLGLQNLFLQINVSDPLVKEKYIEYFAFLDSKK